MKIHCEIQVRTILVCTLYSIKYVTLSKLKNSRNFGQVFEKIQPETISDSKEFYRRRQSITK
jgi:hypothetical protein